MHSWVGKGKPSRTPRNRRRAGPPPLPPVALPDGDPTTLHRGWAACGPARWETLLPRTGAGRLPPCHWAARALSEMSEKRREMSEKGQNLVKTFGTFCRIVIAHVGRGGKPLGAWSTSAVGCTLRTAGTLSNVNVVRPGPTRLAGQHGRSTAPRRSTCLKTFAPVRRLDIAEVGRASQKPPYTAKEAKMLTSSTLEHPTVTPLGLCSAVAGRDGADARGAARAHRAHCVEPGHLLYRPRGVPWRLSGARAGAGSAASHPIMNRGPCWAGEDAARV